MHIQIQSFLFLYILFLILFSLKFSFTLFFLGFRIHLLFLLYTWKTYSSPSRILLFLPSILSSAYFFICIYTLINSLFTPLKEKFCCLSVFPHPVHLSPPICHWFIRFTLFDLIQLIREFLSLA